MTSHHARAVGPRVSKELRDRDDAGRPRTAVEDTEGGAPLRCCLRRSRPGERVVLVSYAPLRRWAAETGARPGAYDEQGPVFLHAGECRGPGTAATGYPFVRPGVLRVLRRYSADGHILGGHLLKIPETADRTIDGAVDETIRKETAKEIDEVVDAALTDAFAAPEVALVHVRAVEYGCFLYEVRRPRPGGAPYETGPDVGRGE
ncbi:DUF1203 domain-containing protein [Streptomyces beigongshangae]|uniref:DUF1203 domain-containing protein n=1 Tax=Streptomyces beigongshangae TaxID=2841597 RepID=UPI001C866BD8|nr:DUF1203 domain-containing protein [Streptomyces sp. REN17]